MFTNILSEAEMADAAESVRVVLTDACHSRGPNPKELLLLTGSKSAIEQAIAFAIVDGVHRGRERRAQQAKLRWLDEIRT